MACLFLDSIDSFHVFFLFNLTHSVRYLNRMSTRGFYGETLVNMCYSFSTSLAHYFLLRSVPKDGLEGLANRYSVRMGIRMDPCDYGNQLFALLLEIMNASERTLLQSVLRSSSPNIRIAICMASNSEPLWKNPLQL